MSIDVLVSLTNNLVINYFTCRLIELWETGLTAFWIKTATPSAHQCFARAKRSATVIRPLRLDDVQGIFITLGFGISFSALIFVFEVTLGRIFYT